ncbi:MAG: hypothetical protein M3Y77_16730 [Actinomycetota bacterium]|nr:hypothetical protein [Actinomycetota bacterium]
MDIRTCRDEERTVHVDCETCSVRGKACSGCVITMLLGAPPQGVEWDDTERVALEVLADSGLVRPFRLSVTSSEGWRGERAM